MNTLIVLYSVFYVRFSHSPPMIRVAREGASYDQVLLLLQNGMKGNILYRFLSSQRKDKRILFISLSLQYLYLNLYAIYN